MSCALDHAPNRRCGWLDESLVPVVGAFLGRDADFAVMALQMLSAAWAEGMFWPRWLMDTNFGLGGTTYYSYPPLAHWAAAALSRVTGLGNGALGDPVRPSVVVAANGGSDLIYLPNGDAALARRVVTALAAQDYTSGLFVNDRFGDIPGTLPLSVVGLQGSAATPHPDIILNFRSFALGCDDPTTCGVEVADTALQQSQGMHGSSNRADTRNIMGAIGPDFRTGFIDPAPASNADIGRTVASLLKLPIANNGQLLGRVLTEVMPGGEMPPFEQHQLQSALNDAGLCIVLRWQSVGRTHYFDAAGYPGCTAPGFLDTWLDYAAHLRGVSSHAARASSGLR
jgi:hypothetical protein